MEKVYIKKIRIEKVRHIVDETICLNDDGRHLILTGKNGSGKTSVLEALSEYLNTAVKSNILASSPNVINYCEYSYDKAVATRVSPNEIKEMEERLNDAVERYETAKHGLDLEFNISLVALKQAFERGEFVLAYYRDERKLFSDIPKHVEKTELKDSYDITEEPRRLFVKYLLDMKMTEALAAKAGKNDKADEITNWFIKFEQVLREIYMDDSIKLDFDEETFAFHIIQDGKEPFGFNELSRGFAAILDIVVDLMIRMEKHINRTFRFDMSGIVLIDEIETHLHLELQKRIMTFLTTLFPNIQFIVSTHSPFILNSIGDVVIYDLEKKITVSEGLQNIPYDGIVESYFDVDRLSDDLRNKFEEYRELVAKKNLSDKELARIAELELYLSEIPDYLALDITTEFERLKAEFDRREDI